MVNIKKTKGELTIRDFAKNQENPFLSQAVEKVENHIVKKYRNSTGTSKSAILTATDSEGNVAGHTSFVSQIEVDDDKFTKLYLSNFKSFFNLPPSSIRVFGYIMTVLIPKKDMFYFIR